MDMEDSMVIQNQIRENSDDLQSFLRDMDHWEKDMRQKEAEMKLMNISEEQECPPIRNSLSRSKKRNRNKKSKEKSNCSTTEETANEPKVRISGYNYKAWDKFDVESELKKVDEGKKESSASESSDEEEEEMSVQSKRQLAIIKKDNGNKFFKDGSYDSAINCYTIGMELDPDNALLPANRAMAFLKKEQFQAAENDCSLCISLDPTYVKAYLRRGSARSALKKFFLAKSDFSKALEIEPDNKQAQVELEKIDKEINMESHSWKIDDMEAAKERIFLEPNNSNVEIMEIQEEKDIILMPKEINAESCNGKISDMEVVQKVISMEPNNGNAEFIEMQEVKDEILEPQILDSTLDIKTKVSASLPPGATEDNLCDGIENVILTLEQTLPPVPTASFQFLTDWKKISKYTELKYSYLKQISPNAIQDLFKHYIEPELFPEILHTLSTSFIENGDDVFHYMKSLTTVGRFSTMLMFLSNSEKEDIKKLKSYLEISGYDTSEVTAIMRLYGV